MIRSPYQTTAPRNAQLQAIRYILLCLSALLLGCTSQENPDSPGLGHIRIGARVDSNVSADAIGPIALTLSTIDGGYSHTWSDVDDFPVYESFCEGRYIARGILGSEGSEGFDCPCYIGEVEFDVISGEVVNVDILCRLSQAKLHVRDSGALATAYPDATFMVHSEGHTYIDLPCDESRPLYLQPGNTRVAITIEGTDGQTITLDTGLEFTTTADKDYTLSALLSDDAKSLDLQCGNQTSKLDLSTELFDTPAPMVKCVGFESSLPVVLTEGLPSTSPLIMEVTSPTDIATIMLTTLSDTPPIADMPMECDLLSPECPMQHYGLKVEKGDGAVTVDFTTMLESISVGATSDISFVLQASDGLGRLSAPTTLSVSIHKVNISIAAVTGAVIGTNRATVALAINVPKVEVWDFSVSLDQQGSPEHPLDIVNAKLDEATQKVILEFIVPGGINDIAVNIRYMDNAMVTVNVPRIVPQYRLIADPFAATARVQIVADKPEIVEELTRYVRLKAVGTEMAIAARETESGMLICTGLTPDTRYAVTGVIIEGNYEAETTFVTERAAQIPDGDFEDAVESIDYKHLASGGVYSSTAFPIFNQQNFKDIKVYFPKKYWASTNAKTFCSQAKRHNTWYLQPTAAIDYDERVSGSKSMRVSSVGWSLDGPEIPPYLQEPGIYQPYSGNVPACQHISAGYVFLGTYRFNPDDMTESVVEGISFGSRPSSLNGFFKYIPVSDNVNDSGWIKVQVINVSDTGTETVIAKGEMRFAGAPFFKAFNLPLVYDVYNLKASKVKIMFCSSAESDAPSIDDTTVPVMANISEALFTGSTLWIDNLSFSY